MGSEESAGPYLFYIKPCSFILSDMFDEFTIIMGLSFGLAVTALISLLISLLMLHQVNRHDDAGASYNMKGY
ncbi:hypothetical protein D9C73_024595 [Collichthys lucidus]|uniref:Uncharacterized protein n=1 Tax=Collichthys lucidus TaxID=240159 RepID=A0A4U5VPJ2_COLLU|nr:hypothetical protein D9C73_024595 [Collichthys lucidus]